MAAIEAEDELVEVGSQVLETAAKRGQTYVIVFIDLDRKHKPVVFVTPGRGKDTVARFKTFLAEHGGSPNHIVEVVCDMSGRFAHA